MDPQPIIVLPSVEQFEVSYRLPAFTTASERQIAWARIIRSRWLKTAFDQLLNAPKDQDLYVAMNEIRNSTSAPQWIDIRERTPISYLIDQAKLKKDERERQSSPYTLNAQMIEAMKTPRGGWTKQALALLGVGWPAPKGWKTRKTGSKISPQQHERIVQFAEQMRRAKELAAQKAGDDWLPMDDGEHLDAEWPNEDQ